MPPDIAVHSDILVHWTGNDIEKEKEGKDKEEAYIQRLRDILCYGLWMTNQTFEGPRTGTAVIPQTPCLCFTELKLSESGPHAKKYGKLGIGVKRPFLFTREGRPVVYYGFSDDSPRDILLMTCMKELKELPHKRLMHFFKPMNSERTPLNYDFYSESEWRIVFHDGLITQNQVRDPSSDRKLAKYVAGLPDKQRQRLRYLVPLDGWFAVIIYPSIDIKNRAQRDTQIRKQIKRLKVPKSDHGNRVEKGNLPVELDLDLCMHL